MPDRDVLPPDEAELIDELKQLRRRGILQLPNLATPAFEQAVRAAGRVEPEESVGAYMIEDQIRGAVAELGGDVGIAAELVLGLDPEGRFDRPPQLREVAAQRLGVGVEHFRRHYEPIVFQQIAQLVLGEIHRHRLRLSRLRMDVRTPVGSRLAVEWLNRFEAMYRIWTPVTGLGNDLTAYRSTLLEPDRPWDRDPDPDDPNDRGYTQERQAAGYVTDAFYHFAKTLWAEKQFVVRFGGLWLLPDAQAETDLADAMHRIRLASPNNERDDSHLRTLITSTPNQELDPFLNAVAADNIAMSLHTEWQQWTTTCRCAWQLGQRRGREMFPTHLNHPDISSQCDVHTLIHACNDYCLILDDAWDQIADWYHDVPRPARIDTTAEEIYARRDHPLPGHLRDR